MACIDIRMRLLKGSGRVTIYSVQLVIPENRWVRQKTLSDVAYPRDIRELSARVSASVAVDGLR